MEKRERKPNGYWTKEECYRAASECGSRNEFKKKYRRGYIVALKNKWLDDYDWFEEKIKPSGYWTKEQCFESARDFNTRSEFQKNCGSGYDAARRNGWLDDYYWFEDGCKLASQKRIIWTKEECYRVAQEYSTRKEFEGNCGSAYQVARKNKWLDDYYWFEDGRKLASQKRTIWTKEKCYEEACKYGSRSEFQKKCKGGYDAARRNGWLDDYYWFKRKQNPFTDKMDNVYCYYFTEFNSVYVGRTVNPQQRDCNHRISGTVYNFAKKNKTEVPEMVLLETNLSLEDGLELEDYYVNKFKKEGWKVLNKAKTGKDCGSLGGLGSGKWTKEECYRAAKEYNTLYEFAKKCCGGYYVARKNNWLDELFPKREKRKPNGFWTKEECYKAAIEYKTRKEFEKNCGGGYHAAYKNNWLDELFSKNSIIWTKERCYEIAQEYNTRSEFQKKCKGGYDAARRNGWLDDYYWFEKKRKPNGYWTKEECYRAASEYKTRKEFAEKCGRGYITALRNNWLDDYYWFEEKYKPSGYWTKEQCCEEARKYGSRNEFRKKCGSGYQTACKNKWVDEFFPKGDKKKPNGYWTKEQCYEEAQKYKTRYEFQKNCGSGYQTARRNNWLDELFPKNKKTA